MIAATPARDLFEHPPPLPEYPDLETVGRAALPGSREVVVQLEELLEDGEGVSLHFRDGPRLELRRDGDLRFRRRLPDELMERPFVLCRTPEEIPEASLSGRTVPNRVVTRLDVPAWMFPAAWLDRVPSPRVTGGVLSQDYVLHGSWLPEGRRVRVLTPGGVADGAELPLVFALDGQDLFAGEEPAGGVPWCLDRIVEELVASGLMAPFLLVAVDHGGPRRTYEYTFCDDGSSESQGGGASEFLHFLLREVEPMIRRRFRVSPRAPALMGAGFGGLLALWAAVRFPRDFSALAALSPVIGWGDDAFLALTGSPAPRPRMWIDKSAAEDLTATWQLRALTAKLESLGWREGEDLAALMVQGAGHEPGAWADRSAAVLRWLLS